METVAKAFLILETLCTEGEAGVSGLTRLLGFPKSTTHRFLSILKKLGYVKKNSNNGKYFPTLKLFITGAMVKERITLVDSARPNMEELRRETHETINLAVVSGRKVAYIDKVESNELLTINLPLGRRTAAYSTAPGKVFLAYLPSEKLETYLRETELKAYTRKTITSVEQLKRELDEIRKQEFAIDNAETNDGIRCIAAPIFDDSQNAIAAISIAGPAVRMTLKRLKTFKDSLLKATGEISRKL